jgi:carbon-nitrogen hydrolase/uncharacterized protein DUF4405
VAKAVRLIAEAAANGAQLIGFPETWIPGYPWFVWLGAPAWGLQFIPQYHGNSMAADSDEMRTLCEAAKKGGIYVLIGFGGLTGSTLITLVLIPAVYSLFHPYQKTNHIVIGSLMSVKRSLKLWKVNIISFILFSILSITGLSNWLILPKGYEVRGSFLVPLRHLFIVVHQWAALLFMIVAVIHIIVHWPYIKSNLKKDPMKGS